MIHGPDSPLTAFVDGRRRVARFEVATPRRAAPLPAVAGLLAGASEVDITPPPGMPKAGYSANATDGTGFRTRLRARVLHLRAGRSSLAIVQCDLLGGSAVVHRLVARAVAASTDVGLHGLFIGATHTHAGPGQFLGTDFYNRFASNRSGFDPAYTHLLVDRISGAVGQAVATRRPARLAVGSEPVWGLTRNRSLSAHVENATVDDPRVEPYHAYTAVNPWLHLVRVDATAADGGDEPLAAMVVFSVHGTGVPMSSPDYNADLWAYVVGELAHRIGRGHGRRPVVGAIEGTHADVAPALRPGMAGHVEARRIGREIGEAAAELYERLEARLTGDVELAAGLREVDLDRSSRIDGVELAGRPAVGAALVAGAYENTTPVLHRVPPFRPGYPKRSGGRGGEQGEKWVLGSRWLQPLLLPRRSFPRVIPVQLLRIADTVVVGMPFEVTVESGRRIEERVLAETAGSGVSRAIVSSVANEYCGYVTTPEEYARQHYEGGHTLYGPRTLPFLVAHGGRLAADVARRGDVDDTLAVRRFSLRSHRFLAAPEAAAPARVQLGSPVFTDMTARDDAYWELTWRDAAPGNLAWHEPMVRVEARHGDGWRPAHDRGRPVDDSGWAIGVVHLGPDADGHRYAARWYDPLRSAGHPHRFVIAAGGGGRPALESSTF